MNRIGFLKSESQQEKRIALVPNDLNKLTVGELIYIERGYGSHLGYSDEMYAENGASVVERSEIFNCEIICDAKIGDSEYVYILKNKILFGYFHAVQNSRLTHSLIENNNICIAWEDMFASNEHIFSFNNELAGYAAVQHAMFATSELLMNKRIAILGRGNTAKGAKAALKNLNNSIDLYGKNDEDIFLEKKHEYSVFINAVLWDITRKDYLISRNDLKKLKPGSLIIDISCDIDGAIETSHPVSFNNPTYEIDGIVHYSVSNTPSIYAKNASIFFSSKVINYVSQLSDNSFMENKEIKEAIIIAKGKVLDDKIIAFQKSKG